MTDVWGVKELPKSGKSPLLFLVSSAFAFFSILSPSLFPSLFSSTFPALYPCPFSGRRDLRAFLINFSISPFWTHFQNNSATNNFINWEMTNISFLHASAVVHCPWLFAYRLSSFCRRPKSCRCSQLTMTGIHLIRHELVFIEILSFSLKVVDAWLHYSLFKPSRNRSPLTSGYGLFVYVHIVR